MPALIILHPNDKREIRYDAKEWEKDGIDSRLISLTPVELARIKLAKTIQDVQKELRRYI